MGLLESNRGWTTHMRHAGVGRSLDDKRQERFFCPPESLTRRLERATQSSSYRLSWLSLGAAGALGSITETLVRGERREVPADSPAAALRLHHLQAPLGARDKREGNSRGRPGAPGAPEGGGVRTRTMSGRDTKEVGWRNGGGPAGGRRPTARRRLEAGGAAPGGDRGRGHGVVFLRWCCLRSVYGRRKGHLASRDQYTRRQHLCEARLRRLHRSGTRRTNQSGDKRTGLPYEYADGGTDPDSQEPPRCPIRGAHIFPPSNGTGLFKATAPPATGLRDHQGLQVLGRARRGLLCYPDAAGRGLLLLSSVAALMHPPVLCPPVRPDPPDSPCSRDLSWLLRDIEADKFPIGESSSADGTGPLRSGLWTSESPFTVTMASLGMGPVPARDQCRPGTSLAGPVAVPVLRTSAAPGPVCPGDWDQSRQSSTHYRRLKGSADAIKRLSN
ncbi:unnamed protein product [Boreogadus saida]